ncbi:hypothetical protein BHM03_00056562 [Ensete ventricosum]|nr:hypothetical protein BHM03_00056562 [Ensete ventricosum]
MLILVLNGCPELGPAGSYLAQSGFSTTSSHWRSSSTCRTHPANRLSLLFVSSAGFAGLGELHTFSNGM